MNSNFENIPSIIFDWMETLSFSELSETQKKNVLTYFSEETYQELHLAGEKAKHAYHASAVSEDFPSKRVLLEHFDRHHQLRKPMGASSKGLLFWQAAAILLMMLSGGLFYRFIDLKKSMGSQTVAAVDTVYVTKEVTSDPLVVFDTIYLYKEQTKTAVVKSTQNHNIAVSILNPLSDGEEQQNTSLGELNTKPRGSSMKDDSLLKKFGYVSL